MIRHPSRPASQQIAESLLQQARQRFGNDDLARAKALIDRATRLPFDDHEQAWPAALAAHMGLFCAVTDALQGGPEGDSRWLDAALTVLAQADERAACVLGDVLMAVDQDFLIKPVDHRKIKSALASIAGHADPGDPQLRSPQLREYVMSVIAIHQAYDGALAALFR